MDIYEKLDMKTGINAWGTVTKLGGTRLPSEVIEAMADAAKSFVPMHEFHRKAGEYTAGLLGVEACCITCGAAAGLAISAAACMTRGERPKVLRLPDTTDMPNEILMLKAHRILYDQAVRLTGAVIREVGTTSFAAPDLIDAEINDRTALFVYVAEAECMRGSIPLPDIAYILNKRGIPIVVDAAAELPPTGNIRNYLNIGADLAVFSGGKEIRGPQASGLIVGGKVLIDACHSNCCPNYGIGRSMKISKETVAGLVTAVELFTHRDYKIQMSTWEDMTRHIYTSLDGRSDVRVRVGFPNEPGVQPASILRAYVKPLKMTAIALRDKLIEESTPVYVDTQNDEIVLNPQCLEPEEVELLIEILCHCLNDDANAQ